MHRTHIIQTHAEQERCILVGLATPLTHRHQVEEHIQELASLAHTAGAQVINSIIQDRKAPDSAYFIGRGKADELAVRISEEDIDLVIFDDELAPAQARNLEQLTKVKVLDRTGLILDIFAAHAQTKQARTQVELAQLNYLLPRLTRQWTHLSRQVGGIGTKGPGETQLETDRRLVRNRIAHLQATLKKIERQKAMQRKNQQVFFRAALVGYTNAGKSTLMNALTNAGALVEDKLFATLDTTTRKMVLGEGLHLMLSDTVGFIRKLPHDLIASFKTTLAQAIEADLLIHVVDVSHPKFDEHISVVNQTLRELEIGEKPVLLVLNKVDLLDNVSLLGALQHKFPDALFISAAKKIRLEKFKNRVSDIINQRYLIRTVSLPHQKSHLQNSIAKFGHIIERQYHDDETILVVRVLKEKIERLNRYVESYVKNNSAAGI